MKILLLYYTGTYNTRFLSNRLKARFVNEGHEVDLYEINPLKIEPLDYSKYDLLGLGYPIYGFNAPWPFLKFVRKQKFPKGLKTFIYKNSGETYSANDASSKGLVKKLKKDGAVVSNEYHFIMPYNIHFRFEDDLIREMIEMDDKLLDILLYEVTGNIPNIKKYRFIDRFITQMVSIQFAGGDINSFFYRVDKTKCVKCGICVKNCPTQNIAYNKKGNIKFKHNCLMCMRCSLNCPKDAIRIGFLEGWRVNGPYDLEKISKNPLPERIINEDTKGFFKCYVKTYRDIENRHKEIFGI
ncbi:MAG: EFR1 family ferrodoxin [Bacilli bacterium]|nr:EFR1 family ferrodoxin [Bacilli bacterium]